MRKAVISKMGILSGEIGNLISVVRSLRESVVEVGNVVRLHRGDVKPKRYVSVMLLGECLGGEGSTRYRSSVMLGETYVAHDETDIHGTIEPMMPIASGGWLVVVGAPSLQYVRIGHELQVGNVGCGSPVVRLRDAVHVGSRVQFTISWSGKEDR